MDENEYLTAEKREITLDVKTEQQLYCLEEYNRIGAMVCLVSNKEMDMLLNIMQWSHWIFALLFSYCCLDPF